MPLLDQRSRIFALRARHNKRVQPTLLRSASQRG
jgi:hypothetical protein